MPREPYLLPAPPPLFDQQNRPFPDAPAPEAGPSQNDALNWAPVIEDRQRRLADLLHEEALQDPYGESGYDNAGQFARRLRDEHPYLTPEGHEFYKKKFKELMPRIKAGRRLADTIETQRQNWGQRNGALLSGQTMDWWARHATGPLTGLIPAVTTRQSVERAATNYAAGRDDPFDRQELAREYLRREADEQGGAAGEFLGNVAGLPLGVFETAALGSLGGAGAAALGAGKYLTPVLEGAAQAAGMTPLKLFGRSLRDVSFDEEGAPAFGEEKPLLEELPRAAGEAAVDVAAMHGVGQALRPLGLARAGPAAKGGFYGPVAFAAQGRVADVAKGLLGINPDYGPAGKLLSPDEGERQRAWGQVANDYLSGMLFSGVETAASKAFRLRAARLKASGVKLPPEHVQQAVADELSRHADTWPQGPPVEPVPFNPQAAAGEPIADTAPLPAPAPAPSTGMAEPRKRSTGLATPAPAEPPAPAAPAATEADRQMWEDYKNRVAATNGQQVPGAAAGRAAAPEAAAPPAGEPFAHLSPDEIAQVSKQLLGRELKTAKGLVAALKASGVGDPTIAALGSPAAKQPGPSGGPPAPDKNTGLINPVQTGVPGIVSGAVEVPVDQPKPGANERARQVYDQQRQAGKPEAEALRFARGLFPSLGPDWTPAGREAPEPAASPAKPAEAPAAAEEPEESPEKYRARLRMLVRRQGLNPGTIAKVVKESQADSEAAWRAYAQAENVPFKTSRVAMRYAAALAEAAGAKNAQAAAEPVPFDRLPDEHRKAVNEVAPLLETEAHPAEEFRRKATIAYARYGPEALGDLVDLWRARAEVAKKESVTPDDIAAMERLLKQATQEHDDARRQLDEAGARGEQSAPLRRAAQQALQDAAAHAGAATEAEGAEGGAGRGAAAAAGGTPAGDELKRGANGARAPARSTGLRAPERAPLFAEAPEITDPVEWAKKKAPPAVRTAVAREADERYDFALKQWEQEKQLHLELRQELAQKHPDNPKYPAEWAKLAHQDRNAIAGLDEVAERYARINYEGAHYQNYGEAPFGRGSPEEVADNIFRFLTNPVREKPSRDAIYRDLAGRAMGEHEEAQAGRADEPEGATAGAATEVEPGVLFGPPAGPRAGAGRGGAAPVSQYEILETAEALLGPKSYVLGRVPGPQGTRASYDRVADAIRTSKMAAGDAGVDIHERAHDISDRYGIESDPARLATDVRQGLKEFDYDPARPMGKTAMLEGFAEWLRMRSADRLPQMTPEQQAADRWAEQQLARHPELLDKLNRLREMFRRFEGMTAQQKAESYFATGREPARAAGLTPGEKAGRAARALVQHVRDAWLNRMGPMERAEAQARKGGLNMPPGTRPSELMYFYGRGERDAAMILEHGPFSDAAGHRDKTGPSLAEILEPLKPEERAWAGMAAGMIHAISEDAAGRPIVSPEQLDYFKDRVNELKRDPAQYARVEEFHRRLTAANNALLQAGADAGFFKQADVADWVQKRPDYVAALRNARDVGWEGTRVGKGEQMSNPIKARGASGEQLVDPLLAYVERAQWMAGLLGEQEVRTAVDALLRGPGMGAYGIQVQRPMEAHRIGEGHVERVLKQLGVSDPVIQAVLSQLSGTGGATYFAPARWVKGGENLYVVMKDGQPTYWKIGDKAFYDLLTKQQGNWRGVLDSIRNSNPYLQAAAKAVETLGRGVRAGAVGLSLPFQTVVSFSHAYDFFKQTAQHKWSDAYMLPAFFGRAFKFAFDQATGRPSSDFWLKLHDQVMGESAKMYPWERHGAQAEYEAATGRRGLASKLLDIPEGLSKVMTAGFNAPVALEFRKAMEAAGYDQARMEANRRANPDDVFGAPLPVIIQAREAASRVVAKYERAGYVAQGVNKVDPFLTAHLAHLYSYFENWQKNPRGMATGLAIYLGLKTLHWLAYKDDPDYAEESGQQRSNDFRVKMPWGDWWRIPGPRGLDAGVGSLYEELLRQTSHSNPRFADTLKAAVEKQLPPHDLAGLGTAWQLQGNESWTGRPIVPRSEEDFPAGYKLWHRQLPYAAEQLTGGLAAPLGRGDLRNPFGTAQHPQVSVDDLYNAAHEIEGERLAFKKLNPGKPFPEEVRYQRLAHARAAIGQLHKAMVSNPSRADEFRARQIDLARKALAAP